MLRWLDELASPGIFTTDTTLVIRSWNQWLERVTGLPAATVVGRPLFEVFPEHRRRADSIATTRPRSAGEVRVLAHRFHGSSRADPDGRRRRCRRARASRRSIVERRRSSAR